MMYSCLRLVVILRAAQATQACADSNTTCLQIRFNTLHYETKDG